LLVPRWQRRRGLASRPQPGRHETGHHLADGPGRGRVERHDRQAAPGADRGRGHRVVDRLEQGRPAPRGQPLQRRRERLGPGCRPQRAGPARSGLVTVARGRGILAFVTDVTRILAALEAGDTLAADQLLPLVYDELRRLAAAQLAREKPGHTLDATALVHEAYLRLVGPADEQRWQNRGHFFAACAEAMRR